MDDLEVEAGRLLNASLATSTLATYSRGLRDFDGFRAELGIERIWPAPTSHIVNYIAKLSLEGKAPSTIETHVASLAYVHKINGWDNPTDNFIIKKLKEGSRRLNKRSDCRRPITRDILHQLIASLPNICMSAYEVALFRAAFSLAFFGFLRIGEFTATSRKGDTDRVLSLGDVSLCKGGLEVNIRSSKTDQRGMGSIVRIEGLGESALCPVSAVTSYVKVRTSEMGPFFLHFGGSPLTRYQFSSMLNKGISLLGLPPGEFSSHSFRIGAATVAACEGIPIERIMVMGRWRSSAVKTYVRPSRVIVPGGQM